MSKIKKKVISVAVSLGLCGVMLGTSTTPVYAVTTSSTTGQMDSAVMESWTWRAAGREAITWGVCGAVGGAAACTLGTPTMAAAAGVGAVGGAVGGFLTYAAGQAYDWAFGRTAEQAGQLGAPSTALD